MTSQLITYISILIVGLISGNAFSSPCADKGAVDTDIFYQAEAYEFEQRLQSIVRDKDIDALVALVDQELNIGPRLSSIEGKQFAEVFSKKWRDTILSDNPDCQLALGWWERYQIGGISYTKRDNGAFAIHSIYGVEEENLDSRAVPRGWRVGGELLAGQCFYVQTQFNSDFRSLAKYYSITDIEDFRVNIGKYLGKEIPMPLLSPSNINHVKASAAIPVDKCLSDNGSLEVSKQGSVTNNMGGAATTNGEGTDYAYQILAEIPLDTCQELAPNLKGKCKSSFLIRIGSFGGGSGFQPGPEWDYRYNIYGVFELPDGRNIVAPLKNSYIRNDALNYLEEMGSLKLVN